jgi:mannitol/fructose-specific phosphotransferase system IIA component (Ntr-type)
MRLSDLLQAAGRTRDRDRLLEAVLARERQRTTAVGRGLAIPHAKTDACPTLVLALGRTAEPLDFEAIDGNPVRLVVLVAGPMDQASQQIQVLARVSRLVINDEALRQLLAAESAASLIEVVRSYESP